MNVSDMPAMVAILAIISFVYCLNVVAEPEFADGDGHGPVLVRDGELDLEQAIRHFENLYRSSSSIAEIEMTVTRPRRTQSMRMRVWTEGVEKSLVVIQAPPREKGTATLKVNKNLWNYMPRIKRTIRIPPSMMLASWMGSDFTNDDLVREASMIEDYTYTTVGPSDAPPGWLVRFAAKPGVVGLWSRIDLVLSEDGALPMRAAYYDRRDRLARNIHWEDVRVLGGRKLPTRMILIPEGEEGRKTTMQYHKIEFDVALPADIFSLSRLEQSQ